MKLTVACVQPLFTAHPQVRHLVVGYSGGVDSHVLLHLLATHSEVLAGRTLTAVYVDHGLQAASGSWGRHCADVCRELGVEFFGLRADVHPAVGESSEATARRARYDALAKLLGEQDALLMAHHLDDQAETLLLQLLRGGGVHGLAAMPVSSKLGRGLLLRPLLGLERAEILSYAHRYGLTWVEDSSNIDLDIDRNYLRHEILPRLKTRWPAAARTLARSAELCADAAALADIQGDVDLGRVIGERLDCLNISALRALGKRRQRNLLRRWFRRLDLPTPSAAHLRHILDDAIATAQDRRPWVHWPGAEVRRYRDRLFAMTPLEFPNPSQTWPLTLGEPLHIPSIGQLILRVAQGEGLRADALTDRPLSVRLRRGGERFHPAGRRHSQTLKKLFQEAGIPPWERDRLPLLYAGDELAAVPGLGVAAQFLAEKKEEESLVLEWQKASSSGTVLPSEAVLC